LVGSLITGQALAVTVTLKGSGGAAWTGTANTCIYTSLTVDSAGNLTATCQAVSATPSPPIANNVGTRNLQVGSAFSLSLADYVTRTDGDVPSSYTIASGALPAGLAFTAATGLLSGTPSAEGTSNLTWTATDKDGVSNTATLSLVVAPAGGSTGTCAPTPGNFATEDWTNYSSSTAVFIRSIPVGNGIAVRFTPSSTSYPLGTVMSDLGTGAKIYSISTCAGDMTHPVGGQNGSMSVNGDSYLDNCNTLSYLRYPGYSTTYLATQTTCWLSPTGGPYYLNILNMSGAASADIQLKNGKLLK
jgi:hypothetical protein